MQRPPLSIMVTGANGFLGARLCTEILSHKLGLIRVTRDNTDNGAVVVGDICTQTDWIPALSSRPDVVVHLAARVHVLKLDTRVSQDYYDRVNVEGTELLARQCALHGVKRFIFVSTIKVNGDRTLKGIPFTTAHPPDAQDPYAISKLRAERVLQKIAEETGMELVIIRPPLIYGPGVKGNFALMMRWLCKGVPLPLLDFSDNLRSFVSLENMTDLLIRCLTHPGALGPPLLVSDDYDLSTVELISKIGSFAGKRVRLFRVPKNVLKTLADFFGKTDMYYRLSDSLQVDIEQTKKRLSWKPPCSFDVGLRSMVDSM